MKLGVRSLMSSGQNFVPQVCEAFRKAVEGASGVTLEGKEREFRRWLVRFLFDELLGWEGFSKVGEILDITCFDNEGFPIILVETKWGVEPTHEIKEKLRKRIEELGSVKYGVFASERDFIVYEYSDYKLEEVTKINVVEAAGVARGEYGLSEVGKSRILKLELLKRERLVWIEDPEYFERTYKEISLVKVEGVRLLTDNLKTIVKDLNALIINFFNSYWRRPDYSGRFLQSAFNDWLKLSMKHDEFEKGDEKKRQNIIEVFCRETTYVLVGRILFIRICEDKGILKPSLSGKRLAEFLKFYEKRRENVYLRAFYDSREEIKRYYSHLHELGFFDWWWVSPDKIGLLTDDDRRIQDRLAEDLNSGIKKCLRKLNRFDFTQVNRDILGGVYQGYLPSDERKRLGEFYTPAEVIEYILDAVGYKPENEIRGKKILDPACGSGSFLVEATQRLMERYRRTGFNLKNPDDAKQIIDGCINSIHGLDIHPFACFIAEMNLLFQLVDLYDVVISKDKYYELPRLNIYRSDSLMPLGKPIELTEFFDNSRRKMLIEETQGADKIKKFKFDYVVGNPPYVRTKRIPTEYKEKILANAYPEVYHGDNDLCVYFIAKGIDWLNNGGKFGYIVSRKFTKTRYGIKIGKYIPDKCCIEHFLDFEDTRAFRDVTNYPCILILRIEHDRTKRREHNLKYITIKREKNPPELLKHIWDNIGKKKFSDDYIEVFEVPQISLEGGKWRLVPSKIYEIFTKIKKNSELLLGQICKVDKGIYTGLDEAFVVDETTVKKFSLEKELLRSTLRGEYVRRYRIVPKKLYLIYPRGINIGDYPNTKSYLEKFRDQLEKRWCVTDPHMGRKWFELEKPRSPELYEPEKIITPDISDGNNFTLDREKYYPLATCFVINLNSEYRQFTRYFLGLLDSKVLEFYFKQISTFLRGKYYRYIKQYLEQLPIKGVTDENKYLADKISQGVDQNLQLYEKIRLIKEKIERFPHSYFENDWSYDKLANAIKTQTLSKPSYTISEKLLKASYLRDLDGKDIFRIFLAPDEYVDFSVEEEATYVLEVLKTKDAITKRELLELMLPTREHVKDLMYQYRKDRDQITTNEKAVEELEKQIDELVYRLYDITYAERRIIEYYLKKL